MMDFEARRVIEALRSGVTSRAVGQYFSSARQDLLTLLSKKLNAVCETQVSDGMIISGRYGEGKTHLLNTVFNMAQSNNMVVSFISLSKETPFDKLYLVYQKLLHNTYLPKRLQPGFINVLSDITPNSALATEMQALTAKQLTTDKLYYLFRAYLRTDDQDEKYLLLADLEGDFINLPALKRIYKRIFNERAVLNQTFSKTKHMDDYLSMLSYLFLQLGYSGWVILFDEAELIGRLSKKARLNAYKNMASFLFPGEYSRLRATYSLFMMTSSYIEEVVDGKHEFENLREAQLPPQDHMAAEKALQAVITSRQLQPLNKEEIYAVMERLLDFYGRAYDWRPQIDIAELYKSTDNRGYLLRTRIRAIVEYLDQLYQYGQAGGFKIGALGETTFEEDIPELPFEEVESGGESL